MIRLQFIIFLILNISIAICNGQSVNSKIEEIRKEFYKINSDNSLMKDSAEISNESTEDGKIYSFRDTLGRLKKIVYTLYGEKGKLIEEYYISNEKLILVLSQQFDYNRPIYWTKDVALANGDSIAFDLNKSVIFQNRYYFDNNEFLILWIDSERKVILDSLRNEKMCEEIRKKFRNLIRK